MAESTRITDIRPVNVRVEKSAVEYRDFRAEMAEVEEGAELNVAAAPVRAAKIETVEPAWKITLKKPAEVRVITEYRSIVDRLKGRRDVVVSETRGGETVATLYGGVKIRKGSDSEVAARVAGISAETVKRVRSKVLEEFEMPESDTAVITKSKPKSRAKAEVRTPFNLDEVVKSRIERAKQSETAKAEEARVETLTVERKSYVPRSFNLLRGSEKAAEVDVTSSVRTFPSPPLPVHPGVGLGVDLGQSVLTLPKLDLKLKPEVGNKPGEGEIYVPVETPRPKPGEDEKGDLDLVIPTAVVPFPIVTPKVVPDVTTVPKATGRFTIFSPGVSLPPLYLPAFTPPQQGLPSRRFGWSERKGTDWWTGLMAGFNVLSRYELSGLAEGRKGVHMLVPEVARPYWERFLISAGFASIPVAQQMEKRRRGRRKKRKRRR